MIWYGENSVSLCFLYNKTMVDKPILCKLLPLSVITTSLNINKVDTKSLWHFTELLRNNLIIIQKIIIYQEMSTDTGFEINNQLHNANINKLHKM